MRRGSSHSWAGRSLAATLACIFLTGMQGVAALRFSDFLIATAIDDQHSYDLIQASAACREGIRLYVATNASVFLSNPPNEFWGFYPDEPERAAQGLAPADARSAQAPWLAFNYYGLTFKWLLYGDDDTVFFIDKVMDMVKGLDPQQPYLLSDAPWWAASGRKEHARAPEPGLRASPRCVPCNFRSRVSGSVRVDLPEGCPCNTTELCLADKEGEVFDTANCTVPTLAAGVPLLPFHGGAGAIISIGLLRQIPYKALRTCVKQALVPGGGGDAVITHCLFRLGLTVTDPGYRLVHPGFSRFDTRPGDHAGLLSCLEAPKSSASKACLQRLRAQATLHARADAFDSPTDAAAFIDRLCSLYADKLGRHREEL